MSPFKGEGSFLPQPEVLLFIGIPRFNTSWRFNFWNLEEKNSGALRGLGSGMKEFKDASMEYFNTPPAEKMNRDI